MKIFVSICGIIACFLFASGFASGAGKAFDEKQWGDFGLNCTLCVCFLTGLSLIVRMWCGV